jgi:hypothetical protein
MPNTNGPWWMNTWWGRGTAIVNVSIVIALLLLMLWKSLGG